MVHTRKNSRKSQKTRKSRSFKHYSISSKTSCVHYLSNKNVNLTKELMNRCIMHAKPLKSFKKGKTIVVCDRMQKKYSYILSENPGKNMDSEFKPYFSPSEMLELGVFEGKYCNDCLLEFPKEWFASALKKNKLSPEQADPTINYFKLKSRMSLQAWIKNGWIPVHELDQDVRGWMQWFCRYYLGRRIPEVDIIQIRRWKQIKRHYAQVKLHAKNKLLSRPKQRQTLLQWSYNCFV